MKFKKRLGSNGKVASVPFDRFVEKKFFAEKKMW